MVCEQGRIYSPPLLLLPEKLLIFYCDNIRSLLQNRVTLLLNSEPTAEQNQFVCANPIKVDGKYPQQQSNVGSFVVFSFTPFNQSVHVMCFCTRFGYATGMHEDVLCSVVKPSAYDIGGGGRGEDIIC